MLRIIRWFVSGWQIRPKAVKKPYRPLRGEFFEAHWEIDKNRKVHFIAEQITESILAVNVDAKSHFSASGTLDMRVFWKLNSVEFAQMGEIRLMILGIDEEYVITLPKRVLKGVLYGKLSLEFVGKCSIRCTSTGLETRLNFLAETCSRNANFLKGCVVKTASVENDANSSKFVKLYNIEGFWDSVLNIIDLQTVFF